VKRQAESDRKLVSGACHAGELVDRTLVALEAGEIDERRLGIAALVPGEREAFDLDQLLLATDNGEVLGADPHALLGLSSSEVTALVTGNPEHFLRGTPSVTGLVARCKKQGLNGRSVALVGVRSVDALLRRIGKTANLDVSAGPALAPSRERATATCRISDGGGGTLTVAVAKSKDQLYDTLRRIDEAVLLAAALATGVALIIAVLLARSLGRPIAELAAEARKVASGEARPLRVRGSGEIGELTAAFDKMLEDLEGTRRRLAATSRVAAWREVARRVAHEIKNPLAPIRAAIETLRRLRARQDPAFDDYFDEATRTVLDEVHRISNIVTEFTRFARLPVPRPTDTDLVELVRSVVALQRANASDARIEVVSRGVIPHVLADREQIIQIVTNLVQNAADAIKDGGGSEIRVVIEPVAERGGGSPAKVAIQVEDDGPGIAPEMAARLFEPYATNKKNGTGLGLAIAQRIAIEHDGELAYVDRKVAGAAFRLVLPVEGPPPVSEMPTSG
jgi:signal transduction histidine kinase